jgi:hypothetical protein
MPAAWLKRGVGASLLGLFLAWHAAAFIPLHPKAIELKSCCKRSKSCCCRRASAGAGQQGRFWNAAADCSRQCRITPGLLSRGDWLPAAGEINPNSAPPALRTIEIHDSAAAASHSYLAYLYQRPPPLP